MAVVNKTMSVLHIPSGNDDVAYEIVDKQGRINTDKKADPIYKFVENQKIVNIHDGADDVSIKELVIGIDPVQDLHGQDSPYPAGGSKNMFSGFKSKSAKVVSSNELYVDFSENEYYVFSGIDTELNSYIWAYEADGTFVGRNAGSSAYNVRSVRKSSFSSGSGSKEYDSIAYLVFKYYDCPNDFDVDEANAIPMQMEIGQTPTSYVPFSNICPITGWTGCEVERDGLNLIDADTVWADFLQSDGTFYHPLGTTHWNIPASLVGVQLTISAYAKADANNANLRVGAMINGAYNNGTLINNTTGFSLTQLTFIATSTDDYISLQNSGINGVYKDIQLELGTTASDYVPFNGNTYPISWQTEAGTVYGGTLTVNADGTGEILPTYAIADMGDLTWTLNQQTSNHFWQSGSIGSDIEKPSTTSVVIPILSDILPAVSSNDIYNHITQGIGTHTNGTIRLWYDGMPEDSASFLSGHKIVYPLATTTPVPLTVPVIKTLLGVNNLWADTGKIINLIYPCDTKTYINNLFSSIPIASGVSF